VDLWGDLWGLFLKWSTQARISKEQYADQLSANKAVADERKYGQISSGKLQLREKHLLQHQVLTEQTWIHRRVGGGKNSHEIAQENAGA
jgi:hypothetical protein